MSSEKKIIGFIAGSDLLIAKKLYPPDCVQGSKGSIELNILGGTAPYHLTIIGDVYKARFDNLTETSFPLRIEGVSAGEYQLSFTDTHKKIYTDSFYFNSINSSLPPSLEDFYELNGNHKVEIDASKGMESGVDYSWKGPRGFHAVGPKQTFTNPGVYTLTCVRAGCITNQDITISDRSDNFFKAITLFPNPSKGNFFARVELLKPADIYMTIYSVDGKRIHSEYGSGLANYILGSKISANGAYLVVFRSNNHEESRKIVIAK